VLPSEALPSIVLALLQAEVRIELLRSPELLRRRANVRRC
jgi:hypothetical protein